MLLTAPRGHVKADFASESKQRIGTKPGKVEEINARHSIKLAPHINSTAQAVSVADGLVSRRRFFSSTIWLAAKITRDSCFALGNLRLIGFIQRNRLAERKEMFFSIIADQQLSNGGG